MKFLKPKMKLSKFGFLSISALLAVLIIGFSAYFFIVSKETEAQAPAQCTIQGWAWSGYDNNDDLAPDEGIGWISFNSDNDPSSGGCGNGNGNCNYGVVVDTNGNGDMVGYAWSSNIGWIKFDPGAGPGPECLLGACYPSGGGTIASDATIQNWPPNLNETRDVVGWARACAVFQSGCDGLLRSDYELGGWDGWISMRGQADDGSVYGVWYDNDPSKEWFEGFAWGGPINVGWISFNSVTPGAEGGDYRVEIPNANSQCLVQEPFDYGFSVETPTNWPYDPDNDPPVFLVPVNATITGLTDNDSITVSLTDVEITSVPPAGAEVTIESFDLNPCTPDSGPPPTTCIRQIEVKFDLTDYVGSDFAVDFLAKANTNQGDFEKTAAFIVSIIFPLSGGNACTATPSVAFVNQPVSWDAQDPSDNIFLPYLYTWHHPADPDNPDPSNPADIVFGNTDPTLESYSESGLVHSYAQICGDDAPGSGVIICDPVEPDNVCSAAIILNPEFDPF